MDSQKIYEEVQKHYSNVAKGTSNQYANSVAKAFGYSEAELSELPEGSNLGLSCGNPIALGSLKKGETVIDFGSGAGFDVFLAAKAVGENGKVIGVDMNKDMLAKANANKERAKASNVEFVVSQITKVAVPDGIADCIISNCVVNLVPQAEKPIVFQEMFRLLKPGGRVAISDILAKKPLPEEMLHDIALLCGCIAGASETVEYEKWMKEAGFGDIMLVDTQKDLNVYLDTMEDGTRKESGTSTCCAKPEASKTEACCDKAPDCCTPSNPKEPSCCSDKPSGCCASDSNAATSRLRALDLNSWAGSYNILGVKPVE